MNREPLKVRAAIVAAVTAAVHAAVILGWLALTGEQEKALVGAVDLLAGLILILWVRPDVTPVADPRDGAGRELQPTEVPRHAAPPSGGATIMEAPETGGQHGA